MTQTSTTTETAEKIASLTATRDKLIATANEEVLPLTRERALRLAEHLTRQIADLTGSTVCGMCQLHVATETVTIPGDGEVQVDLTCAAMIRAFL